MAESWEKQINDGIKILEKAFAKKEKTDIPNCLKAALNTAMATAKEKGEYTDRTGNLRNSIHINHEFKGLVIEPSDGPINMPAGLGKAELQKYKNSISGFIGAGAP